MVNVKPEHQAAVLTMGNFDGVHLGHQQLIKRTIDQAKRINAPSIVMTFEPHPFEFFSRDRLTVARLTRMREKCCELFKYGVDYVLIMPFNQDLANLSASEFVNKVYQSLQPKHIVVGDDFQFGRGRTGDFSTLSDMGKALGYTAESIPTVMLDDQRVSSTRVRKALAQADHALVRRLLGRPYTMLGKIRHGDKLGRKLGFPSANIFLHRKLAPVSGVYTVLMHGISELPLKGAANVGTRPAVGGTKALLEVHLLDFDQDIYGREVRVEFCEKLREEVYFPSLELLKEQIAKDVEETRKYFKVNYE